MARQRFEFKPARPFSGGGIESPICRQNLRYEFNRIYLSGH
jgi:hypothetical protein